MNNRYFLWHYFRKNKCNYTDKNPLYGWWVALVSTTRMKAFATSAFVVKQREACWLWDGLPIFLSELVLPVYAWTLDMFGTCADPDFLLIFAAAMCPRHHVLSYYGIFGKWNLPRSSVPNILDVHKIKYT